MIFSYKDLLRKQRQKEELNFFGTCTAPSVEDGGIPSSSSTSCVAGDAGTNSTTELRTGGLTPYAPAADEVKCYKVSAGELPSEILGIKIRKENFLRAIPSPSKSPTKMQNADFHEHLVTGPPTNVTAPPTIFFEENSFNIRESADADRPNNGDPEPVEPQVLFPVSKSSQHAGASIIDERRVSVVSVAVRVSEIDKRVSQGRKSYGLVPSPRVSPRASWVNGAKLTKTRTSETSSNGAVTEPLTSGLRRSMVLATSSRTSEISIDPEPMYAPVVDPEPMYAPVVDPEPMYAPVGSSVPSTSYSSLSACLVRENKKEVVIESAASGSHNYPYSASYPVTSLSIGEDIERVHNGVIPATVRVMNQDKSSSSHTSSWLSWFGFGDTKPSINSNKEKGAESHNVSSCMAPDDLDVLELSVDGGLHPIELQNLRKAEQERQLSMQNSQFQGNQGIYQAQPKRRRACDGIGSTWLAECIDQEV